MRAFIDRAQPAMGPTEGTSDRADHFIRLWVGLIALCMVGRVYKKGRKAAISRAVRQLIIKIKDEDLNLLRYNKQQYQKGTARSKDSHNRSNNALKKSALRYSDLH